MSQRQAGSGSVSFTFAAGGNRAPATRVALAPDGSDLAPRFAWPERTVFEVRSVDDLDRRGHYLLAYEDLPGGEHRLWEAGRPSPARTLEERVHDEVGVRPSVRLDKDFAWTVHGLEAWAARVHDSPLLAGGDEESATLREVHAPDGIVLPCTHEEAVLEWYAIAGLWKDYAALRPPVPLAAEDGTPFGGATTNTIHFEIRGREGTRWSTEGTITYVGGADELRVDAVYTSPSWRELFPVHFMMLLDDASLQRIDQLTCTLELHVVSERRTLLPRTSRAVWGLTAGEHRRRRVVEKTYRQTGWDAIRWTPLD